jgi:hypothetical protein
LKKRKSSLRPVVSRSRFVEEAKIALCAERILKD